MPPLPNCDESHTVPSGFWRIVAVNDLTLTDMETCYKVFRGDILRKLDLKSRRFGFEPEVTIKIIELVEDPKSTARDLHEVIKNDPALSVKVLKVVNSAFYGLPGQVASVDRAIILLGLSAVKNIAIAASIARLFKGKRISQQFTAADRYLVARESTSRQAFARAGSTARDLQREMAVVEQQLESIVGVAEREQRHHGRQQHRLHRKARLLGGGPKPVRGAVRQPGALQVGVEGEAQAEHAGLLLPAGQGHLQAYAPAAQLPDHEVPAQ